MPDQRWRVELVRLVDETLTVPQPVEAQVARVTDHVESGDVRDIELGIFTFQQLFRLAAHLSDTVGSDAVENALTAAVEFALRSYRSTADPTLVRGLSRQLRQHGMVSMSLSLLERGAASDVGPVQGPPPGAVLWNALGEMLRDLGDLTDAEPAYTAALELLDATPGQHREQRSTVLNNLGLLEHAKGDLDAAKTYLLRSLDEAGDLGSPSSRATTIDNLGGLEVALARRAGPYWLNDDYVNEGVGRHLREAERHFGEAQRLYEADLPASLPDYIISLLHSVDVAESMRDEERCDELTARAAELAMDPLVPPDTRWDAITRRGGTLLRLRRPRDAVDLLGPGLRALIPMLDLDDRLPEGVNVLLQAAAAVGDWELVGEAAEAVVRFDDLLLPARLAGASEARARRLFGAYALRTEIVLGCCLAPAPEGEAPTWLYELVLRRKGLLAERQGSAWLRARSADGVDTALLETVRDLRREIAQLDLGGVPGTSIQVSRSVRAEAERRLERAETDLHRAVDMASTTAGPIGVEELRGHLGPATALLDLTTVRRPDGSRRYVAFVIRDGVPIRFSDLGLVDEVDDRLRGLIEALSFGPSGDRALPALPALFTGRDPLPAHLVVSPTGLWGMVPACLLPGPNGRPLIDDHVVSSVPSARSIVLRATRPPSRAASGAPVVLGDPDFDLRYAEQVQFFLRWSFPRLVHSGTEAVGVAERLGVRPLLRQAATRAAVLGAQRPRILHIATHGIFIDAINSVAEMVEPRVSRARSTGGVVVTEDRLFDQPAPGTTGDQRAEHRRRVQWLREIGPAAQLSRSALLLSGCNAWLAGVSMTTEVGTGLLSADEFALLDLDGADLVVLSACATGVGAVDYADGSLLGLRTAALAAGVSWCVSSLWEVDDAATATMMSAFYQRLSEGEGPAEALRTAQLALRTARPDPYLWAGWVAEGA
jgi:tetratricopeptide (TPR) repeat protein